MKKYYYLNGRTYFSGRRSHGSYRGHKVSRFRFKMATRRIKKQQRQNIFPYLH